MKINSIFRWFHGANRASVERIKCYNMTTVSFGLKNSPFLAIISLHEIAKIMENKYPRAAKSIMKCFYVDQSSMMIICRRSVVHISWNERKPFEEFGFNSREQFNGVLVYQNATKKNKIKYSWKRYAFHGSLKLMSLLALHEM